MEGSDEDEPAGAASQSDQHMTTTSRHHFGNARDSGDAFSITIIESMKEDYGLFVWPCSVVLAEYVWQQRSRFIGASVVELGAGTSLPGLVAAKLGSDVTLTDNAVRLEVLDNMRRVCDLNELKCEILGLGLYGARQGMPYSSFAHHLQVLGLTWGMWDAAVFNLKPKIILGADVLYDTNAFDDLFATVTFLLQNTLGSVFITTYHNRSGHHLIEFLMVKWGLKCVKLLDGFSFMPPDKASGLSGSIQLAEIVLNCEPVK